ncbi:unknown [Salmonella phage FelixO1]|uniref:Uncharacterized protein n=1 Tax=Salmonella phage Felix O1 (isolate Felix O1-VT1) TaxID=1283336 RepID=Q6KGB5_BPFO1|nr:unknown [Salmonella phage FelixO1]
MNSIASVTLNISSGYDKSKTCGVSLVSPYRSFQVKSNIFDADSLRLSAKAITSTL